MAEISKAGDKCLISVIVKALNEEKRIERCLESALAAVLPFAGEVVLADSCSIDRTISLAKQYPVKIVQLANASERCCGVGPQLGYQHCCGEFVYILDGDMEMVDGFLANAIAFMRSHPEVGGVGGRVVEMNTESLEYQARTERAADHMAPGEVDRLDMGGMYRRAAIEEAGYLSDRNLHSYEEFELATRLRSQGWKLWRMGNESVRHFGHDAPPYGLLVRRWKSRYIFGLGELLRATVGFRQFGLVLKDLKELRIYLLVIVWWVVILLIAVGPFEFESKCSAALLVVLAPVVLMTIKKRSVEKGIFSVVSWCFNAAGLLVGMFLSRTAPRAPVKSIVVQEGAV